jgi:hypothetical protein
VTAEIIDFKPKLAPAEATPGNGAREALVEIYAGDAQLADAMLVRLWSCGFKVVPIEFGGGA